mgnify:CR=1 FL=1
MNPDEFCEKDSLHLHNYFTILEGPGALKEACLNCGHRVIYNKRDGKIDNAAYLRNHLRDTVQPGEGKTGKLYSQIYGEDAVKAHARWVKNRKAKPKLEDVQAEARDMIKTLGRKSYLMP